MSTISNSNSSNSSSNNNSNNNNINITTPPASNLQAPFLRNKLSIKATPLRLSIATNTLNSRGIRDNDVTPSPQTPIVYEGESPVPGIGLASLCSPSTETRMAASS
jgi:hypothetical protein